jgi:predicted TIM-barrel enzyme
LENRVTDILKVQDFIRMRLTRDGAILHDQSFKTEQEDFTEFTADRAVLATSMTTSQAINLGGVSAGRRLMLETDKAILVGLGVTPANKWAVGDNTDGGAICIVGSFSHIWVRNNNTQEARIEYVVTD